MRIPVHEASAVSNKDANPRLRPIYLFKHQRHSARSAGCRPGRPGRCGTAGRITWVDAALLDSFGLDPDILHLNHGAFGVAPVAVRRVAAAWRNRAERNPHRFNRVELPPLIAAARDRAAGFLGIDPSRTAWVRNVSEGVSAVLGSLELRPRDELVMSTHGYGAVGMALRHHAARAGAEVVEAAYPVGAADATIVSAYAAACSSRTRLVVIDRITSPTATVIPAAAVAAAVAGPGRSVLVDAAHAPGQLDDDIAAFGADHWIGNLHKWAYTPRGSAILCEPARGRGDADRAQLAASGWLCRVVRLPGHVGLRRLAGSPRWPRRTGRHLAAGRP